MYSRKEIYTYEKRIDRSNVIDVLRDAYIVHLQNADRMRFLLNYEEGFQPLQRVKKYRTDIDVNCVDNVANEITNFNASYKWGNPFTITQRGEKENFDKEILKGISELNLQYELNNGRSKTQELGRNVEITALGYTYVEPNYDYKEGQSYFRYSALNPLYTFVVKSGYYIDKRDMMAVTFRSDNKGNTYFTCFTEDEVFIIVNLVKVINNKEIIEWLHDDESGYKNPMEMIPIVEWFRDYDRMGVFERQIPDMDSLNILASDICNATEEAVQAIWHCNDVDFPVDVTVDEKGNKKETVRKPKSNDWLQTFTSPDGKTPFVTPLSCKFDYQGNLNYYLSKRALILEKCNVPQRSDNSGGSTTGAMDSANGYTTAELIANKQQSIQESCKMKEIALVLRAISLSDKIPQDSPLLKLKITDVQPNIKRSKNFEMATKTNALATMLSHGIHGLHALKVIGLFSDPLEVYKDSQSLIDKYQKSIFDKQGNEPGTDKTEKAASDDSDQVTNSPLIDGMNTENPKKVKKSEGGKT